MKLISDDGVAVHCPPCRGVAALLCQRTGVRPAAQGRSCRLWAWASAAMLVGAAGVLSYRAATVGRCPPPHALSLCAVRRRAGIQEMLERVAKEKGMVWEDFFGKLKSNNQWHVEVY